MPQPAENQAAAERLIDAYREAYDNLLAEYRRAVLDPRRTSQTRRLRALLDHHQEVMSTLESTARTWFATTLPELHAAGALSAAEHAGTAFTWTQPHTEAVNEFVTRTWDDVAARLREVDTTTRRVLRSELRSATRSVLLEGKTAVQAGRELAREAARAGVWSVRYSNGARHTIADYIDSVIRTTTAEAYNVGSVTQSVEDGFTHVEYFDGDDCGVDGHNTLPKANGMVVPVEEVVYLSHPRCRRAILPATPTGPLVPGTTVQLADATAERPTVPARQGRAPRTPRSERTARTPRTPRAAS